MTNNGTRRRPRKIGRWILLGLLVVAGVASVYRRGRAPRPLSARAPGSDAAADTPRVIFDSKRADSITVRPPTPAERNAKDIITRVVPNGVRVKVEVLNGTDVSGLARRGMFAMRDAGFDVVNFGSTKERSDTTIVIDRTGHADWAAMAVKSLSGPVLLKHEPDDSRYVDLTILLGLRWTPPSQPFHP
ncbi:MAG: LytR C-terminal domain-containing protein [bacterium]|jgi:hypothetical protein|nr:LytR family transcriptional regulator [bacterium]